MPGHSLFVPGFNCWRVERAERLAFLIDGAAYFAALRACLARARRSIFIVGWDFDSRIRLVPGGANDGYPEGLGDFLAEITRRQRTLRTYVLAWDFVSLFAMDREWQPLYKLGWRTHPAPRVSYRLDDTHPLSGSHHQKVVVVDDAVAFVGGLDLSHGRWDTPAHRRDEPERRDARGRPARPYHDVQAIVDGPAARALGELCRDRWRRATRQAVPSYGAAARDPWPSAVVPELRDIDVAIARTDPGYVTGKPVEEIRELYVGAIAAARKTLYLENQYFSSSIVGASLAERLGAPHAPEVVIVSRLREEGWLEAQTMGVLRARLHARLQEADRAGRYRLFYPHVPGLDEAQPLNVHSKVLIMDEELCSVGSANLNNRSMGFDTECNIAIEARGERRVQAVIAALRNRLLAEHLGAAPSMVEREVARGGGISAAIEALGRRGRTLRPIDPAVPPEVDLQVPAAAILDPERPVPLDDLIEEFVPARVTEPMAARVVRYVAALLLLGGVAATWRWTPLHDWTGARHLLGLAAGHATSAWAFLVVLAVYAAAGLLLIPVTVLILAAGVVFGPLYGGVHAFAGTLFSAVLTYQLGRRLGRDTVRRLAGSRLNDVTVRLSRGGVLGAALLRLAPVAPFSVVNMAAGASRMRLRDYVLGTALGMAPGIALTMFFLDRLRAVVSGPGWLSVSLLAALVAAMVWGAVLVWRRFGRADFGRVLRPRRQATSS